MTRKCEWCGDDFETTNPRKRFCGDNCSSASRMARKAERDREKQRQEAERLRNDPLEQRLRRCERPLWGDDQQPLWRDRKRTPLAPEDALLSAVVVWHGVDEREWLGYGTPLGEAA